MPEIEWRKSQEFTADEIRSMINITLNKLELLKNNQNMDDWEKIENAEKINEENIIRLKRDEDQQDETIQFMQEIISDRPVDRENRLKIELEEKERELEEIMPTENEEIGPLTKVVLLQIKEYSSEELKNFEKEKEITEEKQKNQIESSFLLPESHSAIEKQNGSENADPNNFDGNNDTREKTNMSVMNRKEEIDEGIVSQLGENIEKINSIQNNSESILE